MVNYMLSISADLENLTNLQPQAGCDDPSFTHYFKVKCGNCGELSAKETCVSLNETVSVPKSRGTAHLLQKCKFCDREGTITMIPGRGQPLTQEASEAGKPAPLMVFDCRGFEPVGFAFGGGWKVESVLSLLPLSLPEFLLLLLHLHGWTYSTGGLFSSINTSRHSVLDI
ncbi:hypothetical protein Ancab_022944 [Ancistrocladus abbreviatus]